MPSTVSRFAVYVMIPKNMSLQTLGSVGHGMDKGYAEVRLKCFILLMFTTCYAMPVDFGLLFYMIDC